MIALVDGDIIAYRNAAVVKEDSVEYALIGCDRMMQDILAATEADEYLVYLSGSNNFRYQINPDYKANRKDIVKPPHLQACRDFLCNEWNAKVVHGYEADDALGIQQDKKGNEYGFDTVICTIDKDLLQVPGYHYNFVNKTFKTVSQIEGIRHFYAQMLIGDKSDNIVGVDGLGVVKSGKILNPLQTEEEMMVAGCSLYNHADRFQMNADCLWIWQEEGVMWSDRMDRRQG